MAKAYRHLIGVWVKIKEDLWAYAGKNTSEATLATNITQEQVNVIEFENAVNEAKKGAWSYPISCRFDTNDAVAFTVLKNSLFGDVNRVFEVMFVFKNFPIKEEEGKFAGSKFNAIITAESIGGAGQSVMTLAYTISNSGDIKHGIIDMSSTGAKYDALTNTFNADPFTEDATMKDKLEGDPEASEVFSVKEAPKTQKSKYSEDN